MPVTNATFDFTGTDVTTSAPVFAGGAQSGSVTEQGISFSFSSNADNANFSANPGFNLSVSNGTALLTINDTPDEEFFSNLVFDFGTSPGSAYFGSNSIVLSRTKTDDGAALATPVTAVITNAQITSNAVVNAPAGKWNTIQFNSTGFMILDSITATVNCFLAGTAIASESGETAVETLKAGDLVRTADGRLEKVLWLGEMQIDTRLMHPARVNPVCIRAGALGKDLPKRDLYLSADHAIEIDGTLYNAGALVNGSTIRQVGRMPKEGFTYYHVETEAHELLVAEGVASESFIDYVRRDRFDNADTAGPRIIPEMALPRVASERHVPDALKARLGAAAEATQEAA